MARATYQLIEKLREAADNLDSGAAYNWGNATKCNCAHLVQCIEPDAVQDTFVSIRHNALDEWSEYAKDYCPLSGAPADVLLDTLYNCGLTHEDIHQLEYLSNRDVLAALPGGFHYLEHGKRDDVIVYMRTWASVLEAEIARLAKGPASLDAIALV